MWDPDVAPVHSFEALAREAGLGRARMMWEFYREEDERKRIEAKAIESAMAYTAANRGEYVWNEEIDGYPAARLAKKTYTDLYRASLNQRGCSGGEYLDDEDFMRWFLSRPENEACKIKVKSPHIRGGWTPELEAAAWEGRREREARVAARGGIVADEVEAAAAA